MLQKLNEEYLLNLSYRLDFEIELRTLAYSVDQSDGGDTWLQPMYLVPMWNIVKKLKHSNNTLLNLILYFHFMKCTDNRSIFHQRFLPI